MMRRRAEMAKTIAQVLVDVLVQYNVRRVYGLPGDSLNGIMDAIRDSERKPLMRFESRD